MGYMSGWPTTDSKVIMQFLYTPTEKVIGDVDFTLQSVSDPKEIVSKSSSSIGSAKVCYRWFFIYTIKRLYVRSCPLAPASESLLPVYAVDIGTADTDIDVGATGVGAIAPPVKCSWRNGWYRMDDEISIPAMGTSNIKRSTSSLRILQLVRSLYAGDVNDGTPVKSSWYSWYRIDNKINILPGSMLGTANVEGFTSSLRMPKVAKSPYSVDGEGATPAIVPSAKSNWWNGL